MPAGEQMRRAPKGRVRASAGGGVVVVRDTKKREEVGTNTLPGSQEQSLSQQACNKESLTKNCKGKRF